MPQVAEAVRAVQVVQVVLVEVRVTTAESRVISPATALSGPPLGALAGEAVVGVVVVARSATSAGKWGTGQRIAPMQRPVVGPQGHVAVADRQASWLGVSGKWRQFSCTAFLLYSRTFLLSTTLCVSSIVSHML